MATLVRWEPFREIAALQNEMSRFMNGLVEGNGRTPQSWIPTADVWETDGEVVYAFDLPGIPEDQISVELDDGALTISAERTREHTLEDGRFHRVDVDGTDVQPEVRRDLLEIEAADPADGVGQE